jgi:hypothetical protein
MSVLLTVRELSSNQYKMADMTGNSEEPIPTEDSVVQAPSPDQPQADFFLQAIVGLANSSGIEIGITLCVGGAVVSGQLISGKAFFKEIANEMLQASGPAGFESVKQSLSEFIGNIGRSIYESTENVEESGQEVDRSMKPPPGYIHLRDAKFFHNSGQPMPGNRGIRWRGRLSAVDGFSLGALFAS